MTIGQIIVFAMICLAFYLGYKTGHNDGYVKGRIAVRRYYEAKASK